MTGIDHMQTEFCGMLRIMITHISRNISIRPHSSSPADKISPGTAAKGHLAHGTISGLDKTYILNGQSIANLCSKSTYRHRLRQKANTPETLLVSRFILPGNDKI